MHLLILSSNSLTALFRRGLYSLLEAAALPSVFTLGKEPFALGKVRSAKIFSAKDLCRVLFIGALGKIKNNFAECLGRHSAKYFRSFHRSWLFCRGPDPALGKKKLFFLKITLPSAPAQALGKVFLFLFFKNTLPSAPTRTLGKVFFLKKKLCRVRQPRHSAKNFWIFFGKNFAECLVHGTRQRPREL